MTSQPSDVIIFIIFSKVSHSSYVDGNIFTLDASKIHICNVNVWFTGTEYNFEIKMFRTFENFRFEKKHHLDFSYFLAKASQNLECIECIHKFPIFWEFILVIHLNNPFSVFSFNSKVSSVLSGAISSRYSKLFSTNSQVTAKMWFFSIRCSTWERFHKNNKHFYCR